jgi:L-aspartate oxidase
MIPRYLVNFDLKKVKKIKNEFLVIGSGIAGLFSALNLANEGEVTLLTKEKPQDCNTEYAQGGIAAVIAEHDNIQAHYQDTIEAGAGLCNPHAVDVLVKEGKQRIKDLLNLGVDFDKKGDEIALTKEGAHSCRRILHARGDATGAEIRNSLIQDVLSNPRIKVQDEIFVIDILTQSGKCYGVLAYDSSNDKYLAYLAKSVILATGGAGQLYHDTSNPEVATGDGIALAYRAGVEVMDMEFVQFHPTTLELEESSNFLISEAVRGEGGILRNNKDERFMLKYHELAELAPRDVVARAIYLEMKNNEVDHVYLDVTDLDSDFIKERFPTIYQTCFEHGIDISKDYIPVSPAAHYFMGGIKTNILGETNLAGLFACGETASLGIHGANRLASNSLLDGLVYGKRVAKTVIEYASELQINFDKLFDNLKISFTTQQTKRKSLLLIKEELQELMIKEVGIFRNKRGLKKAFKKIEELLDYLRFDFQRAEDFEVQNLLIIAYLLIKSALIREESRGAHYRQEFPESKIEWRKHILLQKDRRWEELDLEFK